MPKKLVPDAILDAAVAVLRPYVPELTATELVEALGNRNKPTPSSPTIRKPMTRKQAAEILQVSIASINRYIRSGLLKAHKVGKRLVRIDPRSVEALLVTYATKQEA